MRKPFIIFGLIVLLVLTPFISTAPFLSLPKSKSLRSQLSPDYLRAMAAYKRLEPKLTREELRAITTIGILNGAKKAEEQMEQNLIEVVQDLVDNANINDPNSFLPKIERIEKQIIRDQSALQLLSSAMDLAVGKLSEKDFRKEMQYTLQDIRRKPEDIMFPDQFELQTAESAAHSNSLGKRVGALRRNIVSQMETMKEMVDSKIEKTLERIITTADRTGLIAEAHGKLVEKRNANARSEPEVPAEVRIIDSILSEADFRKNLVEEGPEKRRDSTNSFENDFDLDSLTKKVIANRSDSKSSRIGRIMNNTSRNASEGVKAVRGNTTSSQTNGNGRSEKQQNELSTDNRSPAKQEAASPETLEDTPEDVGEDSGGGGGGGGGIVGIITSLSGGEGGSDVGALIGALTGVISTLFGPGGLDVESLISTGTSLIAGLLSGDKNFGTVLGTYVGTALDGLSGGGGAINNGRFLGNFLGTVVASLSADPEEDDAPIQPFVFAENLLNSFIEAKNGKMSGDESDERKETVHPSVHGTKVGAGGSDSGGFIKSIVSHIVSTALSVVLNASLGAVGGASKASTSLLSASSSHKSHLG